MMNLAEDISNVYNSLEQDVSWPPKLNAIIQKVLPFIRHRSTAEKLPAAQYQSRLGIAANFFRQLESVIQGVDNLGDADVINSKKFIWEHQSVSKIKDFDTNDVMNNTAFKPCLANYLAHPWLHCSLLNWIFIDNSIYRHIISEREKIIEEFQLGDHNKNLLFGNISRLISFSSHSTKLIIGALITLPVLVIAALFFAEFHDLMAIISGLYLVMMFIFVAYFPVLLWNRKHKVDDYTFKANGFGHLLKAYEYCEPPIINPSVVEKFLFMALDAGMFIEGSLFALLKIAKVKNKDVLVVLFKQA